jgi:hypothetical protein
MAKGKVTKESVFEEIQEKGFEGKTFRNQSKLFYSQELIREGKIKKICSRYYIPEFAPNPEKIYNRVKESGKNGISLKKFEKELIKPMVQKGAIKTVYKKYYLSELAPLKSKEVVERLVSRGTLQRLGKTYYILVEERVEPQLVEVPSFLEFAKSVQEIYLRMAGEYRQSVRILQLVEELLTQTDIPKAIAEKWIVELPRVFLGRVDLRPFPGEKGLRLDDGSEVARIYLERGIVGL